MWVRNEILTHERRHHRPIQPAPGKTISPRWSLLRAPASRIFGPAHFFAFRHAAASPESCDARDAFDSAAGESECNSRASGAPIHSRESACVGAGCSARSIRIARASSVDAWSGSGDAGSSRRAFFTNHAGRASHAGGPRGSFRKSRRGA